MTRWRKPLGFLIGFCLVALIWYVFAYSAVSDEVRAYLKEQTRTLQGDPVGLQSLGGFVRQFLSFGMDTRLLLWSPIAAIAGLVGLIALVLRTAKERARHPWWRQLSPEVVLVAGWFLVGYLAFSPFNYRPVRYQIVLWLPLAAGFGWVIQRLGMRKTPQSGAESTRPAWWTIPFVFAFVAIGLQHSLFGRILDPSGRGYDPQSHSASIFVGLIVAAAWIYLASRSRSNRQLMRPAMSEALIAILLLGVIVDQGRHILRWWSAPAHTITHANHDLATVLGKDAVATGGWAAPLTQLANSPLSFIHFFASSEKQDFFQSRPLTHVIVEDKSDGPFFRDFPELSSNAAKVTTYTVRNLRVGVWRVAEIGGNAQAQTYQPTYFERIRGELGTLPLEEFLVDLDRRIADSADHFSGWAFAAELYRRSARPETQGDLLTARAMTAYERALSYYPDDFVLLAQAGDLSWERYRTIGGPEDRDRAVTYWQRALEVTPNNQQLIDRLRQAGRS